METIYEGPDYGFKMFLWHGQQDNLQNYQPTLAENANLGERWVPHIPDGAQFEGWFVTGEQAFLEDQAGNTFDPKPMREAAEAALRALLAQPR